MTLEGDSPPPSTYSARAPLLWLLLPLISGYSLGHLLPHLPVLWAIGLALICLSAALLLWLRFRQLRRVRLLLLGAGLVCIAAVFWQERIPQPAPPDIAGMAAREATLELETLWLYQRQDRYGRVSGVGFVREAPELLQSLEGRRVYFQLALGESVAVPVRGSQFEAVGLLRGVDPANPNDFEAFLQGFGIEHLFRRGKVLATLKSGSGNQQLAARIQARFEQALRIGAAPEDPRASILSAMLLGETALLSGEQRERFRKSGTLHLFAISGVHIGAISLILGFGLRRVGLGLREALTATCILLAAYVWIVGAPPSAVRAASMVGCYCFGLLMRRQVSLFAALVLSACLVLIFFPRQLFSPGFQLSYLIVAGIVLYAIPLADAIRERLSPYSLEQDFHLRWQERTLRSLFQGGAAIVAISLAAMLVGGPLIAGFFGVWTPGSILLSIPIALLTFGTLVGGTLSLVGAAVSWQGLSAVGNQIAYLQIGWLDGLLQGGLGLPGLFIEVGAKSLAFCYATSLISLIVMYAGVHVRRAKRALFLLLPVVIFTIFLLAGLGPVEAPT